MNSSERRVYTRIPIDVPIFASLTLETGQVLPALLADISKGGVQLALSPGMYDQDSLLGMEAVITELPGDLAPLLVGQHAYICWVSPQRCGIRFHTPLDVPEDVIKDMAASL